jgi:hypothetical protein
MDSLYQIVTAHASGEQCFLHVQVNDKIQHPGRTPIGFQSPIVHVFHHHREQFFGVWKPANLTDVMLGVAHPPERVMQLMNQHLVRRVPGGPNRLSMRDQGSNQATQSLPWGLSLPTRLAQAIRFN